MLRPGDPPVVMAILNATPDSFSGDGVAFDARALAARAREHVADGAGIVDVGGESTRPGADDVPLEAELARVTPMLRELAGIGVPVSIDTMKPEVADAACALGATIVNDVSGLRDERLASVAARRGAWLVLTHNGHTVAARGTAETGDPVEDVVREIARLADVARAAGVDPERLIADPGIGFGKSPAVSLALVARSAELCARLAPMPVLVGASRKSFIGRALDLPVDERLEGSLACVAVAVLGGAAIVRVHDVRASVRVARMVHALRSARASA